MGIRTRIGQAMAIIIACVGIGGCAQLSKVVERNVQAAQELDQRCEIIGDAMVLPREVTPDQIKEEVVARMRLRFTGTVCNLCNDAAGDGKTCQTPELSQCNAQGGSLFPTPPVNVRLSNVLARVKTELAENWGKVEPEWNNTNKSIQTISQKLADIHGGINRLRTVFNEGEAKKCETRQKCAREVLNHVPGLIKIAEGEAGALSAILKALDELKNNLELLLRKAQAVGAPVNQGTQTEILRLIEEAQFILAAARNTLAAFAQQDILAVADVLFGDSARYRAADVSLRYIEGALAPVDRFIDKVDDKWYLVPSVGMTVFEPDIQQQFDQLYSYIWTEKLQYWDLQLAFARASCARLSASPPPNSAVMPFLYRMFVNGMPRAACGKRPDAKSGSKVQAECVRDGAEPINASTEVVSQEDFKALTIANKMAQSSSDGPASGVEAAGKASEGDLLPTRYTQFQRFEICYQAELAARANGLTGDARLLRDISGYSCGDYIHRQLKQSDNIKKQNEEIAKLRKDDLSFSAQGFSSPGADVAHAMREAINQNTGKNIAELRDGDLRQVGKSQGPAEQAIAKPQPTGAEDFCVRLEARAAGTRCYVKAADSYALEIDGEFPRGDWRSAALETRLERIAEFLRHQDRRFDAVIEAAASKAPVSCAVVVRSIAPLAEQIFPASAANAGNPGGATASTNPPSSAAATAWIKAGDPLRAAAAANACKGPHDDGNQLLAVTRAHWAGDIVTRRAVSSVRVTDRRGLPAGYPYDTRSDRKLTVLLRSRP